MAVFINVLNGGNITIGTSGGGSPAPAEHSDTWYKYAGDTEWRTVSISGTIEGDGAEGTPTTQIPDAENIIALEIGTDVTNIGDSAFYNCTNLTSVTIPNGMTDIGYMAFEFSSITNITIPDTIEIIGDYAFAECNELNSVTIPDSVTNIGEYAFSCENLTIVTIVATGKPGASAANVKQAMIDAGVDSSITWNMPS